MVSLTDLWLPIVLSAVFVFVASSIMHLVLTYHRKDYGKLEAEADVLEAIRNAGVKPGDYSFPCPENPKDMNSPEMLAKYNEGPVGIMTVLPTGPPAMGKSLVQWFIYSLVVGVFVAYLTGRTVSADAHYLAVFRVAGASAFLGYSVALVQDSIWKGQNWVTTIKHVLDGFVFALLTAGCFGWLWP